MGETTPQKKEINWNLLIYVGVSILLGWLAHRGVTPAPVPPELIGAIASDVQEIKAAQKKHTDAMVAAGIPVQ